MKKILLGVGTLVAIVAGVAMMSAYEAHVVNVTAKIENALDVPTEPIDFSTVFPQEYREAGLTIALSESFKEEGSADDVNYLIKQKPKPKPEYVNRVGATAARQWCHDNRPDSPDDPKDTYYDDCYPSLCEYLSKHPDENPENDGSLDAFHQMVAPVSGRLAKSENDDKDIWTIDLAVPCFGVLGDQCAQDWPEFVNDHNSAIGNPWEWTLPKAMESETFGCDLWVEVTGISRLGGEQESFVKTLENKDPSNWQIVADDNIWGLIYYSSHYGEKAFHGQVVAHNLIPNRKYQVTLNGQGSCQPTDMMLGGNGSSTDLYKQGFWTGGPGLSQTCSGGIGEGVYNMGVSGIAHYWTVETDSNGEFTYDFHITDLQAGAYTNVKVLVKLLKEPFISPWTDPADIMHSNLYETGPINFVID